VNCFTLAVCTLAITVALRIGYVNTTCCVRVTDESECCPMWSVNEQCVEYRQPINGYVHLDDYTQSAHCNDSTIYTCEFEFNIPSDADGDGNDDVNVSVGWATVDDSGNIISYLSSEQNLGYRPDSTMISSDNLTETVSFQPQTSDVCKCDNIVCIVNITKPDGTLIISAPSYGTVLPNNPDDTITQDTGPLNITNYPPIIDDINLEIINSWIDGGNYYMTYNCSYDYHDYDENCNSCESITSNYDWTVGTGLINNGCAGNQCTVQVSDDGGDLKCCVDITDSERNGDCQGTDRKCKTIHVEPRGASCSTHITSNFTLSHTPAIAPIPDPDDQSSCPPILPDETPSYGCGYEDSNYTCVIPTDELSYSAPEGLEIQQVCFNVTNDGTTVYSACDNDNSDGYWNITYTNCLEDENCSEGDHLECHAQVIDSLGVVGECESGKIKVHNYRPDISKPTVVVVTANIPDNIIIGDYNVSDMVSEYNNSYLCVPSGFVMFTMQTMLSHLHTSLVCGWNETVSVKLSDEIIVESGL